ncbi:MAG: cupin domain-containing protein, partial [Halioglobus sp.]|nr:cupin domain-containing protein [Halioglobus sp.]
PWTLLVQSVDHCLPDVAALRHLVNFLPQWRIGDVMASYAADGGGVGPHYDNYDVFLLQGEGQRLWRLGQRCDAQSPLLPHPELRILGKFEQSAEYLLSAGDILYVPPGVAHWGIAVGESTTFSIGFRAPRISDMVSRRVDQLLEQLSPERLLSDAGRSSGRPGEITTEDMHRARQQVLEAVTGAAGDEWFGELVTECDAATNTDDRPLAQALAPDSALLLDPQSRLAWQENTTGVTVYAAGEALHAALSVLPLLVVLCERWRLEPQQLTELLEDSDSAALLGALYRAGCVYVGE